jgi:hypothetical protein
MVTAEAIDSFLGAVVRGFPFGLGRVGTCGPLHQSSYNNEIPKYLLPQFYFKMSSEVDNITSAPNHFSVEHRETFQLPPLHVRPFTHNGHCLALAISPIVARRDIWQGLRARCKH